MKSGFAKAAVGLTIAAGAIGVYMDWHAGLLAALGFYLLLAVFNVIGSCFVSHINPTWQQFQSWWLDG